MHIRLAEPKDIAQLADLLTRVWQASYRHIFPADVLDKIEPEKWLPGLTSALQNPAINYYVATEQEKVIGMLCFGTGRDPQFGKTEIYVLNVDPNFQGKGIGKRLMDIALKECQGETIYLHVITENRTARAFYERIGFVESGITTEREMWGVKFLQSVYVYSNEKRE